MKKGARDWIDKKRGGDGVKNNGTGEEGGGIPYIDDMSWGGWVEKTPPVRSKIPRAGVNGTT